MSRAALLENFCRKIGIFSTHQNSCSNSGKKVTYGPYGQLLLEQIKKEWMQANLVKFKTNFLIKNTNLLSQIGNSKTETEFDLKFYLDSLACGFNFTSLPIGLVNVFESNNNLEPKHNKFEYIPKINDSVNFLTKYHDSTITNLNCLHFYDSDSINTQLNDSFVDPYTFWQRERKNWWSKLLRYPENITTKSKPETSTKNKENDNLEDNSLFYEIDCSLTPEVKSPHINWLENIRHLDNNNEIFNNLLKTTENTNLLSHSKQVILTQTNCQNILENILFDSVEFPFMKTDKNLKNKFSDKTVFNLDYRLAPYKACILFESSKQANIDASPNSTLNINNNLRMNGLAKSLKPNDSLSSIAFDLKKLFYNYQINVLVMNPFNEKDLEDKYSLLDEFGVPYAIYLPSTVTKDGLCFIRSRDTSLCEKTHTSLIVKHFCAISNALHF